jgi:phage terminase large subunit
MSDQPKVQFPAKLAALFRPSRYKILYGGRGGAKSWGIARALLILGAQEGKPIRVLCAREFQKSIADSVHKLLKDQVESLDLGDFYDVQQTKILGVNGTEFAFVGLRHNVSGIKSYEGVDYVWVEEAANVSKSSWDTLVPTIRKEGSEIWVSFNPELESDETYQRFVVNPPTNAILMPISWRDNPWFPDVLRQEMLDLKAKDHTAYLTVWEGHCKQTLDGAIYAKEIAAATEDHRITKVPYERSKAVDVYFDLGRSDNTSMWFMQQVGFEHRAIDFYQNSQYALNHYVEVLQKRGYTYGTLWLPHDGKNKLLHHPLSLEGQLKEHGYAVRVLPNSSVELGINAVRTLFPNLWIDRDKCADGLHSLRHYQYEVDEATGTFSKTPLHNWASHGADALRTWAMAYKEPKKKGNLPAPPARTIVQIPTIGNTRWMG